jgi:dipeptide/tripeptide permease
MADSLKKHERDYKDVAVEMSSRTMMLASQVVGEAVKRGVNYKVACQAAKVGLYQGLFAAVLRGMKNDGLAASAVNADQAFTDLHGHEQVALQTVYLIFDHLQVLDRRHVWRLNIVRRELKPGEKPPKTTIPS